MNNYCFLNEKSLIPVHKWLFEAGDGSSASFRHHTLKSRGNRIIKRKKSRSLSSAMTDWFYAFIKNIFTVHDAYPLQNMTDYTAVSIIGEPLSQNNISSARMITTVASSSNLNLVHPSKSTQTNNNEQQLIIGPNYCFSTMDGRIVPLLLRSPSSLLLNHHHPSVSLYHHQAKHSFQHSSSDSIFAENTCHLIKQAWLS
ncbi:unnamed protein product [Adineta ricciae]|uniref:Uncharacterized protein n=1 Tax=Adineta ricciae TaxID=249248 RepID=A0A814J838_ADIRI|nr:unnamed protein product [Adineta ricciae]